MFQRANVGISDELHKHFGNFFIFNNDLPPPVDHSPPFTKGKARLHECFSIEKRSVFATETLCFSCKNTPPNTDLDERPLLLHHHLSAVDDVVVTKKKRNFARTFKQQGRKRKKT